MTQQQPNERRIETSVEIDAPADAVWKALTDAKELSNWFPPFAEVKPGVGGHIRSVWDEKQDWTSPIGAWEPNKHLQVVWCEPTPPDKAEQAKKDGFYLPFRIAVDYHIEDRGGRTVLRLVHSGFSTDAVWDNQYDGTGRGWAYQLRGLKHYLERHRGTRRVVVDVRADVHGSLEEAWARLTGPQVMAAQGDLAGRHAGERYGVTTACGDRLEGEVCVHKPPLHQCVTVENLNEAFLRLAVDPSSMTAPRARATLFLSTYGLPAGQTDALQQRWQAMLDDAFSTVRS